MGKTSREHKGTKGCPSGKAFHSTDLNGFDFVLTECSTGPWKEAVGMGGEGKMSNDLFSDIFPGIIQTRHNNCTRRYYILVHAIQATIRENLISIYMYLNRTRTHHPAANTPIYAIATYLMAFWNQK